MKLFTEFYGKASGMVLPFEKFRLFSDMGGFDIAKLPDDAKADFLAVAEEFSKDEYPQLLASDFIKFHRVGDRSAFQDPYYKRRDMLFVFAAAEAIGKSGKYIDRVMDGVWLICDECDWVIPAHIYPSGNPLTEWCKDEHPYMDLFAAETGAVLALVDLLVGDRLDAVSPLIRERLRYCIHERVTRVYIERDDPWWMGFKDDRKLNNWTTWITSNVLVSTALCETELAVREKITERALVILDRFVDGYGEDGGCEEGPAYWNAAGAGLFDCLEILYDITGGRLDIFDNELVRRIGEYRADFQISDRYVINFADSSPVGVGNFELIKRFGRRVGSEVLESFGKYMLNRPNAELSPVTGHHRHIKLKNCFDRVGEDICYTPNKLAWYGSLQVMICRSDDLFFAVKGGNNGESHNHNDIGSFILYSDGKPCIIDAGVGIYTKKTFSSERYTIWSMRSEYHNTAMINGVGQHNGSEFKATDVVFNESEKSVSMDISGAYESTARVDSYIRKATFADGKAIVCDRVKLMGEGEVTLTLMTVFKPEFSNGKITLGDVEVAYSDNLTASDDESFDMHEEAEGPDSIKEKWNGVKIHRVLLKSDRFTEGELRLELTKTALR